MACPLLRPSASGPFRAEGDGEKPLLPAPSRIRYKLIRFTGGSRRPGIGFLQTPPPSRFGPVQPFASPSLQSFPLTSSLLRKESCFSAFLLTFRRCAEFSRFCSPSEGAQSHEALCSACARVSISSRLFPPSEGVQFSRVFCSPSEGAQSPGTLCRACTRVSVSCRFIPPSEGVQFSRVFCSPSEGAQSHGALCSACARVSVSSRFIPPSEGVQFSRVFCSPSEGAQSHEALCSACARVSVSSRLFPPSEGGPNPAVSVSPLEGEHVYLYRNDRKMR